MSFATLTGGRAGECVMRSSCKLTRKAWYRVDDLIQRWVEQREELSSFYLNMIRRKDHGQEHTPNPAIINTFCECLVDYLSTGHFEIFSELANEALEFGDKHSGLINQLYQSIEQSTDAALTFNDKYDSDKLCERINSDLAMDLKALGHILQSRFKLENILIDTLHNSHRNLVA